MISLHSRGIMLNTLVHYFPDDKGSQWVVYVPSVVKSSLRALVDVNSAHKRITANPCEQKEKNRFTHTMIEDFAVSDSCLVVPQIESFSHLGPDILVSGYFQILAH